MLVTYSRVSEKYSFEMTWISKQTDNLQRGHPAHNEPVNSIISFTLQILSGQVCPSTWRWAGAGGRWSVAGRGPVRGLLVRGLQHANWSPRDFPSLLRYRGDQGPWKLQRYTYRNDVWLLRKWLECAEQSLLKLCTRTTMSINFSYVPFIFIFFMSKRGRERVLFSKWAQWVSFIGLCKKLKKMYVYILEQINK